MKDESPGELSSRGADLVRAKAAWAFAHETELRTMLLLSLRPEREKVKPRRGLTDRGRWIGALLEGLPSDVPSAARDRLAAALIPLFGSDAIVWTTDMADLPRDEAIELLAWMASVLIDATLEGGSTPSSCGSGAGARSRAPGRLAPLQGHAERPINCTPTNRRYR